MAEIFPLIDKNRDMHIDQAEMLAWHDENGARRCTAQRLVHQSAHTDA